MIDNEKVVNALELCIKGLCNACPYSYIPASEESCEDVLRADAVTALISKSHARVMRWDEIAAMCEIESGAVWLEDIDKIHVIPALTLTVSKDKATFALRGKVFGAYRYDYGGRWRAWSAHPSHEQRTHEPWEEASND